MNPLAHNRLAPWHVHAAGALLTLAACAAFGAFLVRPLLAARAQAHARAADLAAQHQSLQDLRSARKDTDIRLIAVSKQLEEQTVRLEPKSRLNERLDQLTELAGAAGLQVHRLSPGVSSEGARHSATVLHLTGRGPFAACDRFVASIHSRFNDTAVITLHLTAPPENTDSPVDLNVELLWYTAPDAPSAPVASKIP